MGYLFLSSFSPEKFMFSRVTLIVRNQACWEREFRDGRKRWQKKTREKRPRNCTMVGLDYTVTLASSMENALSRWRRFLRLSSSHGPSLLLASIRDGKRNRTKGTSSIASQRLPRLLPKYSPASRFPHSSLPLFYLSSSVLFSSFLPLLLMTRKFTRPLHSDRLGTNPWIHVRECLVIKFCFNFETLSASCN